MITATLKYPLKGVKIMVHTITLKELQRIDPASYQLIDIRTPQEFREFHLPRAINIPYDLLMTYPDNYLKKSQTYYLICGHGSLSYRASAILQSYGYLTASISDGHQMRRFSR